ncbi:MAG: SGNH/GDSL hydrolase family protein [Acidimicrobiia bacterium]|nr:SGNH/GDSL hydrolase family protein [Acidimicrobiia bacterium]
MAVSLLAACTGGGDESRRPDTRPLETGPADTLPSGGGAVLDGAPPIDGVNDRVLVLGDSNLSQSGVQVAAALQGVGLEPTLRGVPGLGLKDLDAYWLRDLPGLLATDPAVVVVALGTNDTTTRADVVRFSARLDTMMRAIGEHPVVWVTHVEYRPFQVAGGGHAINEAIRAAAARWPNLTVLDRTAHLESDPSLLRGDRLHFTDAGMVAFGNEIATAARSALPVAGVPAP